MYNCKPSHCQRLTWRYLAGTWHTWHWKHSLPTTSCCLGSIFICGHSSVSSVSLSISKEDYTVLHSGWPHVSKEEWKTNKKSRSLLNGELRGVLLTVTHGRNLTVKSTLTEAGLCRTLSAELSEYLSHKNDKMRNHLLKKNNPKMSQFFWCT